MAFPDDLADVVVFKIHPALGVARVANNDDYYVFGRDPGSYKSNGVWKRQAVQFRLFAYGENHVGLGELTPEVMAGLGLTAVWSAKVANRKMAKVAGTPLSGTTLVISAEASSDDATGGQLVGSLPDFAEGAAIPMGQITATGLFIPPTGGAYRKAPGEVIPPYPPFSTTIADTTSDGVIGATLNYGGQALAVLPACIVVAPQDFSPDTEETPNLYDWLRDKLGVPTGPGPANPYNQLAQDLDQAALRSGTPRYAPGFEVCLGDDETEVPDVKQIFFKPTEDPRIDPREMRVRYRTPGTTDPGAVFGQLTSGLCSPWQGDFTACVGYWAEHLPRKAFLDENTNAQVLVFRKEYANQSPNAPALSEDHGDEFEQHVDKMGVVRRINSKRLETERGPGDDV
jgi:hypothetical protein